jgi:hypothetical protein
MLTCLFVFDRTIEYTFDIHIQNIDETSKFTDRERTCNVRSTQMTLSVDELHSQTLTHEFVRSNDVRQQKQ